MRLLSNLAYAGCLLFFVVAYLRVHQLAAYTFPVPWEDESQYLWMAINFARTGSLHAPEVTNRPLFMMPPGHMMFIGSLFKVFGVSLGFARLISALLVTGSFLLLARMTARYGLRMFSLLFLGVFFLSPPFVVAGNIGRMEALLLFVVCLGMFLLQRRMDYKALAILLLTPLIHPNGTYFLTSAAVYLLVTRRLRFSTHGVTRSDAALLLLSVAVWCAYAFYVGNHWALYRQDMAYQFGVKLGRNLRAQLFRPSNVPAILAVLLCALYAVWAKLDAVFLLALGIPAWLAYGIGHEMWYHVFDYLLYPILSILVVHVICHATGRISGFMRGPGRYVVATVTTAGLIVWNYHAGRLQHLSNYPWNMAWGQMRIRRDVSYVTDADVAAVGAFLDSLRSATGTVRARFYPEADSLLFREWEKNGLRFSQPFFSGSGVADVYIVHTSRALPQWMRQRAQQELQEGAKDATQAHLLMQRDGTEAWFYRLARTNGPG
jgi:hypothetical protein